MNRRFLGTSACAVVLAFSLTRLRWRRRRRSRRSRSARRRRLQLRRRHSNSNSDAHSNSDTHADADADADVNYNTAEYRLRTIRSLPMRSPPTTRARPARASRSASSTAASIRPSPSSPAGSIRPAATSPAIAASATRAATAPRSARSRPRPATASNTMGVAFDATIVSERADDPGSLRDQRTAAQFFDDAIAAGIDAARARRRQGHQPVARRRSRPAASLLAAMQRAVNAGIVIVISAGNDGTIRQGRNPDPFALDPGPAVPGLGDHRRLGRRRQPPARASISDFSEPGRNGRRLLSDGARLSTTARPTRPARNSCGREPASRRRRSAARWR